MLVEGDDTETEAALARHRLPGHIEVLRLPAGLPRTKPRALNVALAAARGSFLVIYDAEDRPDPDQLCMALAAFAAGPPALACVQAALTIDNSHDGWLTRLFTIEYAALFDAFLPSLAALGLPFPLGGSSNHFRVAALRDVGAWDPWNVTEDADLGLRLARRGYGMTTIPSSTFEEAPNRLGLWMRQRTRWLKGYSLTWWIHACRPRLLLADLGVVRFLALNAIVAGVPLSAMTLPVLLADFVWRLPHMLANGTSVAEAPLAYVDAANLVFGFGATAWLAVAGIRRRRLRGYLGDVCWMPVYWLLSSVAAYRALFQLAAAPHLWEKTEHGLARTSRRNNDA
ncbi:MAG TPA: glycosyltransferase family 2 protein [Hyphomicrobiales bacterium]|nr:glycosyltransferase family 2 protein [Hyphomicrobiales bacterium]